MWYVASICPNESRVYFPTHSLICFGDAWGCWRDKLLFFLSDKTFFAAIAGAVAFSFPLQDFAICAPAGVGVAPEW